MEVATARPMPKHAFVEREKPEKTSSGVFMVPAATPALFWGKVVALGKDCAGLAQEGDKVLFNPAETSEVRLDGERSAYSVPQHSILAVEER